MKQSYQPLPESQNSMPKKEWVFDGFHDGYNDFSLPTELMPTELNQAQNIELYGKKSIRPRRGGVQLGGSLLGSAVDGLLQFKDLPTNDILAISNGLLQKYVSATDTWNTVSATTFTIGLRTRAVKMRNNIYFGNGTDQFARYDGTTLQFFTAVGSPSGLSVSQQGSAGATQYCYEVTTVTNKGESLPCALVTINNGNSTLSSTNYNKVMFTRRTESEVIGYNLYGRSTTGDGVLLMQYIPQPTSGSTVTFNDDGSIVPQLWLPPNADSTDGPSLSFWETLDGSLVGAGDPNNSDRLYFSGTGANFESFSPAQNGGWVDVRPGDNDAGVNGLAPFQQSIIVPKENSIHQFSFDPSSGEAVLQEIISYIGCGAPGTMVVMENDIAFVDKEGRFRIIGYQAYYAAAIRTTSLSEGRAQGVFDGLDPNYMKNMEAVFFNGRYLLACTSRGSTVNDTVLVFDRRYNCFLGKWQGSNCNVRCWTIWDGKDGKKRLYAGSSVSPVVFEFGVEGVLIDWDGSAVSVLARFRNEDMKNGGQQKIWNWADFRLYRIQGTLTIKTITNGASIVDSKGFTSKTRSGWGVKRWGKVRWGVETGTPASASTLDQSWRKYIQIMANSLTFEVSKDGAQDDFVLTSLRGQAMMLPREVFDATHLI